MSTVRSYEQYRQWIRSALADLPASQILRFTVWCVLRLPVEFGDLVWDGLTETETRTLQDILNELEAGAKGQAALSAERAANLAGVIENFGPHDEVAAIEVLTEAIYLKQAAWDALTYIRTGDVERACAVSDALITLWDYYTSGNHEGYCLEEMFTFPEMRREIELQEQYIKSLS
jgi:hypothetical protein